MEWLDAPERQRQARLAEQAANRDQLLESITPARELSPGYYDRVLYLLGVESELEMGIHIPEDRLDASTLTGLRALRAAHADFARAYPQCGGCGHRNRRGAMTCRGCQATFESRKAS